jgi:hypothetical protein
VVKAYNYHPSLGGYNRLFSRHGGWKASFKAQPSAKGKRAQPCISPSRSIIMRLCPMPGLVPRS